MTTTCTPCNGTGIVGNGDRPWLHEGQTSVCKQCTGTGKVPDAVHATGGPAPEGFISESKGVLVRAFEAIKAL